MGSITGLTTGNFTDINNSGEIRLTDQLTSGTVGQALVSGGEGEPATWDTHTGIIQPLTMGTDLSLASGNATFDGSVADTINAAVAPTFTGGNGIDITGTTITTDNDGTTINNTGGTGAQNQVLKVPNALTSGTNVSFSAGTTYDGSAAITINSTDTDTTYQGSATININTATNPDTINCLKVPNVMTASTNIIFTNTDDGAAETSYDGSTPITIRATDTNTEYTAGTNLNLAGTTFNLDTSISGMINISFLNDGTATSITGSNYPNALTTTTYLDLSSSTNKQGLPPDCFEVSGDIRQTINLSIFMPDDDSSFYNIGVEDDLSSKIHGSLRILNSSIEVCGFMVIPNGFTAVAARIDVTNSSGAAVTRAINYESFTTYGATGFSALYTGTTNSEQTFTSSMAAASDKLLLIRINTTSTSDHIRGGYIKLTR